MTEPTIKWTGNVIPTGIAECCREWIVPAPPVVYPGGKCGLCGERPTFKRTLPESEWLHIR